MRQDTTKKNVDWLTVFLYITMVIVGWLNIYAAVYQPDAPTSIFSLSLNSGKQLMWIGGAAIIATSIMLIDFKFFNTFAYPIFGVTLIALLGVLIIGHSAGGNTSWFKIGFIRIQPSEFAKYALALALARYIDNPTVKIDKPSGLLAALAIIGLPTALVMLQKDTGSAMVFSAFILMLYREGLPDWIMTLGLWAIFLFIMALVLSETIIMISLGLLVVLCISYIVYKKKNKSLILLVTTIGVVSFLFTEGIDYIMYDVMRPHQRKRIEVLVNPNIDPLGVGYQVTQSKIAIGSGGLVGKGFLEGTQTKFNFVPEQSTDFIFCTIGEEHGWIGSLVTIGLFAALIIRLIILAERQKSRFARVYGYSAACIFFIHFMINMGMTIGIFPVIGIPLPFFSYGGSSLWAFTLLLFTFIKLDSHRSQMLSRS
ncbi:rod shape-determining protein RodA [Flammeovirga kamogawensis]|uniref:Cell wall polymerase n=1 Tax=Flammeovirga kamogawensis TaxID=373891 RepID=A0ABX8H0H6_9BACT|nr:rod shape-determining protein RodA [Flammeovirga kamogawensis]MBB6459350.1 rod shape determining protein RodA [Flammeovirga kamogawensis]QWG08907.1 rod shape-determining protein RodA [Flammeovirga kamogawensis]TRX67198.1 rod shape-determining protein RodA [Flammeovirga kamogawensis]